MSYLSKENVEEVLGLSPVQEGLLEDEAVHDVTPRHVVQATYTLAGPLDVAAFRQAWDHVVALHPALRVVFRTVRNRAVQVVLKARPVPLDVRDVRGQPSAAQRVVVREAACTHRAPFDPAEGPLTRLALIRTAEDATVVVWTYHELILDDRSRDLVLSDLLAAHDALARGAPLPVTTRRPYREYLGWLARQDWTPARDFWSTHLAGFEAATPLTLDAGAAGPEDGLARRTLALPQSLSASLDALAREYVVTPGTLVEAAWAILLSAYSNEADVVFGLTCLGRPAELDGAQDIVGRLANVVPARLRIDGACRLRAFLHDVQQHDLDLATHAHTPLAGVMSHAQLAASQALFDTCLAIHDAPINTDERALLRIDVVDVAVERDCRLAVDVAPGPRWSVAVSSTGGFAPDALDRVLAHLCTLLGNMAAAPEVPLAELAILPPQEQQQVLGEFNKTEEGAPLDRMVQHAIEARAAEQPEAIAAVCGMEQITYGELNARANSVAHWLRAQGFGRDDLAALLARRSIDMLVAILAVAKAGGAYVPLDAAYPDARLLTLLADSKARLILTHDCLAGRSLDVAARLPFPMQVLCLDATACPGVAADAAVLEEFPDDNPVPVNEPADLANVFYTSGSTGQPKGVMVAHAGMLNHLWAKIRLLGLDTRSVVVQNASHCFDISVWQFLAPLMAGGRVVICDDEVAADPQALLSAIRAHRVTVLEVVPTMLEMLLDAAGDQDLPALLPELRQLISTAEALPVSLCRRWLRACPHATMINAYGPTECSDDTMHEVIAVAPPEEQAYMPVGRPISNFKVYVLDRWQRPVPLDCVGEIYFAGVGVGRGYLYDPERTAQAFVPNPFAERAGERMYRTGDLGRFLPDGRLVYLGRVDDQVKVRGRRIELGEIEAALLRHPTVKQGAVIARPDVRGQNRILAYIVPTGDVDASTLRDFLQESLPAYMIPEHITPLDALPLNRNGKVDRKALPDVGVTTRQEGAFTAPRDEIETGLAEIWREVLDVDQVGIDDSFFDLGGHSLKTVQVRSRIAQRFGVDVALRALFEHQTIRALAPVIAEHSQGTMVPGAQPIPRRPVAEHYPMAHAQQRLWFLQQMEPDNCFYNLPSMLDLEGPLDLGALQRAFDTIVERQAGLRTTFTIVDGQPVQRVSARLEWSCRLDDLSALDDAARSAELAGIIRAETLAPFDLEAGPLFRVRLVKLAADRHILAFTVHHIIGDAWSSGVLQRELATLYHAYSRQMPDPLPPLPIQYSDYAHWQNQRLAGEELKDAAQYWLDRLAGPLPVLNLPIDHPRPPVQTYAGRSQELALDAGLVASINQLCQQTDTTLFMVLLAAVAAVLARVSGQEDIIVGTPVAGRDRMELEGLVGFFVNTLPLRLDLGGDPAFRDLLERVRRAALDAYTHQEYPFDQIVQRVNPVRDLSQSPIFAVMFQVNRATPDLAIDGVRVRPYPLPSEHARFDLTVTFTEGTDGLTCRLDYNADLFEANTIARMLRRMETMLQGITTGPGRRLRDLPLLPAPERRQVLDEWNDTAAEYPRDRCLHHLVEEQAERTPGAVAVVYGDEQLTYAELNGRANAVARYLQHLGVQPEDVVGICVERSVDLVVSLLGILKAGAVYLPLDPAYPQERLAFMVRDARVPVLLTQERLLDRLPPHEAAVVCLDRDRLTLASEIAEGSQNLASGATPASLAYVIYTSGSTGRPKGVQVAHRNVVNFLASMRRKPGLTDGDTLLAVTSLSFDIAALEIFLPLSVGARVVVVGRDVAADGMLLWREIERTGATILQATPATWRLLLAAGWRNDGRLTMLCGGEALPVELGAQLLGRDALLWNMYGPTETTIWSSVYRVTSADGPVPIGRPIANTGLYVLDRHLQPAPIGVPGELYIGGDGVVRGYANRPDLTAERFIPHPFSAEPGARLYRTGDLARYRPDGNVEYLGRLDHQVKIRGHRIELGEIETALAQHPSVRQAVMAAREDAPGDRRLVAYVVPEAEQALAAAELRRYLAEQLPEYMMPGAVVMLDELPLTLNGKVDRKMLPAPDAVRQDAGTSFIPPRDALELEMARLWEEALRVQSIGVCDDFFELGGHSLTAVVLMNAIRERFAVDLPLSVLFQKPTVAQLCVRLRAQVAPPAGPIVAMREGGTQPPLFLVHPQGGGVLCYLHLTRALHSEMPVYGLEAIGYDADVEPPASIDAIADRYVAEIRRIAPHGPYRLAGWSFGGLVAYEMARRLEAMDEEIAFLGLVDVQAPDQDEVGGNGDRAGSEDRTAEDRALLDIAVHQLGMQRDAFAGLDRDQGIALVLQRAKDLRMVPEEARVETMQRRVRIMVVNGIAMHSYYGGAPIRSDVHLFRVLEMGNDGPRALVDPQAWRRHTSGVVHDVPIPGTHHSLVYPPHALVLAAEIEAALAREAEADEYHEREAS